MCSACNAHQLKAPLLLPSCCWLQQRESFLKNEPMSNRGQTYAAIRKLLSGLDDPFTRFLEPSRLAALRRGTAGQASRQQGHWLEQQAAGWAGDGRWNDRGDGLSPAGRQPYFAAGRGTAVLGGGGVLPTGDTCVSRDRQASMEYGQTLWQPAGPSQAAAVVVPGA